MITLQDLSAYLEHLMPSKDFPDYAPNGLQVEGKKEIQQIAFAVSAGSVAIQKAIELKADALIVHHGIFWQKDPLIVVEYQDMGYTLCQDIGYSFRRVRGTVGGNISAVKTSRVSP